MENLGATGSPDSLSVEHHNHARPYSSLSAGAPGSWGIFPSSPSPSNGVPAVSPLLSLRPFPPKIPAEASKRRTYWRSNSLPTDSLQVSAGRPLSSPLNRVPGHRRRTLTDIPNLTLLRPLPRGHADEANTQASAQDGSVHLSLCSSPECESPEHQRTAEQFHGDKRTSDALEARTDVAKANGITAQVPDAAAAAHRKTMTDAAVANSNNIHADANNSAACTRAGSTERENYTFQRQEEQFSRGGRTAPGPEVDPYVPSAANMRETMPLQEQGINGYGTNGLRRSLNGTLREYDIVNDPSEALGLEQLAVCVCVCVVCVKNCVFCVCVCAVCILCVCVHVYVCMYYKHTGYMCVSCACGSMMLRTSLR
jgi:hypothetical protein